MTAVALWAFCIGAPLTQGADLVVEVVDAKGVAVANAVVVFIPAGGVRQADKKRLEIVQMRQEFSPLVTIVPLGSTVRFPNRDNVAHHVYSFSPAKKFDLPLYTGEAKHEVIFDREGVGTLGCNIHDWMVAHFYVTAAPFYALSGADGRAILRGAPAGAGSLRAWHPRLIGEEVTIAATVGGKEALVVRLSLRPEFKRRRAPAPGGGGGYR